MELYLGGAAQGKRAYVLGRYDVHTKVVEAAEQILCYDGEEAVIFLSFHEWFYKEFMAAGQPEQTMDAIVPAYPQLVIVCNEVGSGIVPADAQEREYRERLGQYLCRLARQAVRVERILCGIGQRIK